MGGWLKEDKKGWYGRGRTKRVEEEKHIHHNTAIIKRIYGLPRKRSQHRINVIFLLNSCQNLWISWSLLKELSRHLHYNEHSSLKTANLWTSFSVSFYHNSDVMQKGWILNKGTSSTRLLIDKLGRLWTQKLHICEYPPYISKEVFFKNCPTSQCESQMIEGSFINFYYENCMVTKK